MDYRTKSGIIQWADSIFIQRKEIIENLKQQKKFLSYNLNAKDNNIVHIIFPHRNVITNSVCYVKQR